jgi:2-haloacid dehalogenase
VAAVSDHAVTTAIFDLGGVVVEWNPRAAYAGLLEDEEIEAFLKDTDFLTWNSIQDAGRGWDEAEAQLALDYPAYAHLARVYRDNFHLVVDREVPGTAEILRELAAGGVRLLSITNFSAELFDQSYPRFEVLSLFQGIVVSGAERVVKPDPAIFRLLCTRYGVDPDESVFIDDTAHNVAAARQLGMRAVHFTGAEQLRVELAALGLPVSTGARD